MHLTVSTIRERNIKTIEYYVMSDRQSFAVFFIAFLAMGSAFESLIF